MMRKLPVLIVVCFVSASAFVLAQSFKFIHESLTGYEETPMALSTTGNGEFHARISHDDKRIQYQLSYSDLEGTVQQSHIHLGARGTSGGISVFLCTNLNNGPAGTQPCPPAPATITGTLEADDVIGPAGQGITAGQFSELIRAIRAGATYVNVHSTLYTGGEIRSQIEHDNRH
jgi:CHRD domain-containing protein